MFLSRILMALLFTLPSAAVVFGVLYPFFTRIFKIKPRIFALLALFVLAWFFAATPCFLYGESAHQGVWYFLHSGWATLGAWIVFAVFFYGSRARE